ncbi:MAG TPA: LamG domain-containing protein, partial [Polyangiaceae bacterium]|nr:LamG domain-containing protein [Polyangiaceae bacterium]
YWAKDLAGNEQSRATLYKYPTVVLGDGPVGYWRLGERAGNAAFDHAPAHNHGTHVGRFPYSPLAWLGTPGAIQHDPDTAPTFFYQNLYPGPNPNYNYVRVPHHATQAITSQLTLECWFTMKPGIQTYSALISKSTADWQDGYGLYNYGGQEYFFINHMNLRVGVPVPADNTYRHLVGTFDGSKLSIYLNGELAGTHYWSGPINPSSAPLLIGQGYLLGWVGSIDEVAIYNKALSAKQVQNHYRAAKGMAPLAQ